jgi:hypothetical protein
LIKKEKKKKKKKKKNNLMKRGGNPSPCQSALLLHKVFKTYCKSIFTTVLEQRIRDLLRMLSNTK